MSQIIRGYFKGTKLKCPQKGQTRPTSSKVKEAIMSLFTGQLEGLQVVDLYAGSGSMGLEMLSSGVRSCVFVENDKEALSCLQGNLKVIQERAAKQGISLEAKIIKDKVEGFLIKNRRQFDLVWLDPPYKLYQDFTPQIYSSVESLVSKSGFIVFESNKEALKYIEKGLSESFNLTKQKKYGDTYISIYKEGI